MQSKEPSIQDKPKRVTLDHTQLVSVERYVTAHKGMAWPYPKTDFPLLKISAYKEWYNVAFMQRYYDFLAQLRVITESSAGQDATRFALNRFHARTQCGIYMICSNDCIVAFCTPFGEIIPLNSDCIEVFLAATTKTRLALDRLCPGWRDRKIEYQDLYFFDVACCEDAPEPIAKQSRDSNRFGKTDQFGCNMVVYDLCGQVDAANGMILSGNFFASGSDSADEKIFNQVSGGKNTF